ncbi:MAG: hypothetical protein ROW52_13540 [Anaerolineaceae bacterium]
MDQDQVKGVGEDEDEEAEVIAEQDRRANMLLWISSAANVLSWIVLVIFAVWSGVLVYVQIAFGGWQPGIDVQSGYILLNSINELLMGVGLFVLLQAAAKGALVLLDIQERVLS